MLKKNQLVLILLTLVLMLSVYFIRSPFKSEEGNNENNNNNNEQVVSGRLDELKEMWSILNEERAKQVLSLDAIIADDSKTVDEIDVALKEKRYINSLTEQELLLEKAIMNVGYQDCFVHASSNGVDITVVSNENSKEKANEIILMVLQSMNGSSLSFNNLEVSVNFQTVEEVMGNVA